MHRDARPSGSPVFGDCTDEEVDWIVAQVDAELKAQRWFARLDLIFAQALLLGLFVLILFEALDVSPLLSILVAISAFTISATFGYLAIAIHAGLAWLVRNVTVRLLP